MSFLCQLIKLKCCILTNRSIEIIFVGIYIPYIAAVYAMNSAGSGESVIKEFFTKQTSMQLHVYICHAYMSYVYSTSISTN